MYLDDCLIETIKRYSCFCTFNGFFKCQAKCATIIKNETEFLYIYIFNETYFLRTSPNVGAPDNAMTKHVLYSSSKEDMTMGKFFFPCSWIEFEVINIIHLRPSRF